MGGQLVVAEQANKVEILPDSQLSHTLTTTMHPFTNFACFFSKIYFTDMRI